MRARRGLAAIGRYTLVIWAAFTLSFALPRLAPGDPLQYVIGPELDTLTAEQRQEVLRELGFDRPAVVQYGAYLRDAFRGDLGFSIRNGRPVRDLLLERLPWTLVLLLPALVLGTLLGMALGTLAAAQRGRAGDVALLSGILFLDALPVFWIGMMLVAVVSVRLGWLPSFGAAPYSAAGPIEYATGVLRRTILPVATLTLGGVGHTFLLVRGTLMTTLEEDYIRLAEAKGLTRRRVLVRHALRTALLPLYTRFILSIGGLVGGAVLVETVFGYPGVGRLIFEAISARDYPVLQGAFLLVSVAVILANAFADLTYPLIDPRTRRRTGP